jgi:hypothetical protein
MAIGTTASLILTGLSVAYQVHQAQKAKAAREKAQDERAGIEFTVRGESTALTRPYGLTKVRGGLAYWALDDNFVHYDYSVSDISNVVSFTEVGSDEIDQIHTIAKDSSTEGDTIRYNGFFWKRKNATAPAGATLSNNIEDLTDYFAKGISEETYKENLRDSGALGSVYADLFSSNSGAEESFSGDRFAPTVDGFWNYNQGLTGSKSGNRKEYLFFEQALCVGGINRVISAKIDGKPVSHEDFDTGFQISVSPDTRTQTDPMIFANKGSDRGSDAKFTGMASAAMCFKIDRDEPQYGGIPEVEFIVEGLKVHTVEESNGVYSLSSTKVFSNNPAYVLLDYLLEVRGLSVGQLDLESFYKSAEVCDKVVMTNAEFSSYLAMWYGDLDAEEDASFTGPQKLYTFDGNLKTDRPARENIQTILNTMNDAVLTWVQGQYRLTVEYPETQADVDSLVVMEVTDEELVEGQFRKSYPDSEAKFNQSEVSFTDGNKKFSNSSKVWPKDFSSVFTTYFNEDNNLLLKDTQQFTGVISPYQALARAEFEVRRSRYQISYEFRVRKEAQLLQPGDIVRLNSESFNENAVLRVESVKVEEDYVVSVKASSYGYEYFAWNVADNLAGKGLPRPNNFVSNPKDLQVQFGLVDGSLSLSRARLSWSYPNSDNTRFDVFLAFSSDQTLIKLGQTTEKFFELPALRQGVYRFAVQAVQESSRGQRSSSRIVHYLDLQNGLDSIDQDTLDSLFLNSNVIKDGETTAQLSVYKRAPSPPGVPTGGSFDFDSLNLTPPSSWSFEFPSSGTDPVYASSTIASTASGDPVDSNLTWSTPARLVEDGAPGAEGNSVLVVYADDATGSNQTLDPNGKDYVQYVEYNGAPPTLPVGGGFVKFTGADGATGQGVYAIYADDSSGSGQSFDATGKNYVTFYESTTPPALPVSGQSFVPYVGEDGLRGPGRWNIPVSSLPTSSSEASNEFQVGVGPPVDRDQAWFYTGTEANPTTQSVWIYDGGTSSWNEQQEVIDGNLLVDGTVTTDKIDVVSLDAISATIGTFQSAATGERVVISDDKIEVYDSNNVLRVKIGNLA